MAIRTAEISSDKSAGSYRGLRPSESRVGTIIATTARNSVAMLAEAARRLKRSWLKRTPPVTMLPPPTSRRLARIDPVMLPLTRSTWPWRRAATPRMSSAALPKVAFSRLPTAGPMRSARPSVASPIALASGIRDAQATKKTIASSWTNRWRSQATGSRSQPARQTQREITGAHYTASKRMQPSRSLRATRPRASSTSRFPITSESVR